MKIKSLWNNLPFKGYIYTTVIINLLILVLIFACIGFLPPEAPLFYGNVLGESQLTKTIFLAIAPLTSLIILIVNISLSYITDDLFLKKVLIVSALFISILTAITILKIILLVGLF